MHVKDEMTTAVVSVEADMPLKDVAALFTARAISGAPVIEAGEVIGVVSDADIVAKEQGPPSAGRLRGGLERRRRLARFRALTARDAMSAPAVTVEPWMSLSAAALEMTEHDVHRLPVVREGALVGIISRSDLVRAFARSDAEIRREILEDVLPGFGLTPYAIDVAVDQGRVTLEGSVDDEATLSFVVRAIASVIGVADVHVRVTARR